MPSSTHRLPPDALLSLRYECHEQPKQMISAFSLTRTLSQLVSTQPTHLVHSRVFRTLREIFHAIGRTAARMGVQVNQKNSNGSNLVTRLAESLLKAFATNQLV